MWGCLREILHSRGKEDLFRMNIHDLANECIVSTRVLKRILGKMAGDWHGETRIRYKLTGETISVEIKNFRKEQDNLGTKALAKPAENPPKTEEEREKERKAAAAAAAAGRGSSKNGDGTKPRGGRRGKKTRYPREHLQKVIETWLRLTGRGNSDIAKEPGGWGRWIIDADGFLHEFEGQTELAAECLEDLGREWKTIDWTVTGATKRAKDWLAKKQHESNSRRGRGER